MKKNAKIKIPGLTGIGNATPILRIKGSRDYGFGMLVEHDGGLTSPWLLEKGKAFEGYLYGLVQTEAKALSAIHEEAAVLAHQLAQLAVPSGQTHGEEGARQAAAKSSLSRSAHQRLTEIRAKVEMMQLTMAQVFNQAEAVYQAKIMAYWSGAVKASSSETLPAQPTGVVRMPHIDSLYNHTLALMKEV